LNTWTVRLSVFAPVRVVRLMIEAAERVPANGATVRPDASAPAAGGRDRDPDVLDERCRFA
jgi:hypothetical protein